MILSLGGEEPWQSARREVNREDAGSGIRFTGFIGCIFVFSGGSV
jgi:hypothetical protein